MNRWSLTVTAKIRLLGLALAVAAIGLLYIPAASLFVFLASGCLAAIALAMMTNAPNSRLTHDDLREAEKTLRQAVDAESNHLNLEPNPNIARVLNYLVDQGFVRSHVASGAAAAAYGVIDRRHAIEALGAIARAKAAWFQTDQWNSN
jgi:hypothetical protein